MSQGRVVVEGHRPHPVVVILMGVSGSGTTVGSLLAARLDRQDAQRNSADRRRSLAVARRDRCLDRHGIVACSALKRRYREILVGGYLDVRLVYLKGDETLIARRVAARRQHFMPANLLHSPFSVLEEPGADEDPIPVSIEPPPHAIVAPILAALRLGGGL